MAIQKILVVDDEARICELIRSFLTPSRFNLRVVHSGRQAQEAVLQESFDLVITDMSMPDGDGIELIRLLRRGHPSTRIIAMTGPWVARAEDYLNQAKGLSVDGILLKPFLRQQILNVIEKIEAESPPALPPTAPPRAA